jgi:trigger factor
MNINVEHLPNCRASIHVHATADEVAKKRDRIVRSYINQAKLPGYRPGKVPAAVIMKRFGESVQEELNRSIASDGLESAIKNEGLEVVSFNNITDAIHHDTDHSFSCTVEVTVAPRFELPNYKGIPVKLPKVVVTDEEVEKELANTLEQYATYEDVDQPAENGKVVVLSYEAFVDGQPVGELHPDAPEHLKAVEEKWFLLDEQEDFFPGFYASLQGITKDEERSFDVTAESQHFEALEGKTLHFKARCFGVKERRVPELTEAFLERFDNSVASPESIRADLRKSILDNRERSRDTLKTNQILEHLASLVEFELPQEAVNAAAQRRTNSIAQRALQDGVDTQQLMEQQEAILDTATKMAAQDVKIGFILDEIAKTEKLTVSENQLQVALASLLQRSGESPKKFLAEAKKNNLFSRLRDDLLISNAIEFLKEQAVVEEVEPEALAPAS